MQQRNLLSIHRSSMVAANYLKIFGERDKGVGVRSAFGVSGLPAGVPVEIEGILKLKKEI